VSLSVLVSIQLWASEPYASFTDTITSKLFCFVRRLLNEAHEL
jgi:hypothetical protein